MLLFTMFTTLQGGRLIAAELVGLLVRRAELAGLL
jgi:hypothetical protein